MATLIMLVSFLIGASTLFSIYTVQAAETTVFEDDFPGVSLNTDDWPFSSGVSVSGGILNITQGYAMARCFFKYGNYTVVASTPQVTDIKSIRLSTWNQSLGDTWIKVDLLDNGAIRLECAYDGSISQAALGTYGTGPTVYTILWEEGRVRVFINGTYENQLTTNVMDELGRVVLRSDQWVPGRLYVDSVEVREDRELDYAVPEVVSLNASGTEYPIQDKAWFPGNVTLRAHVSGGGTYTMKVYIPTSWRNYFCEVKKNGASYTNLAFARSARELSIKGLTGTVVTIQMVDPPEWMVNFAYWFGSATGISLLPLLKIWDRLAKKHKLLPYAVVLLGLVLLAFAVWFIWQLISFHAAHIRL